MTEEFTYYSLFAGIGGMTMGLEQLGGKCLGAWEFDPDTKRQYANEAHKLLHPNIPTYEDVTQIIPEELSDFDLLAFTPPCQTFSVNGKRRGLEDTKGTLTFDALEVARIKQPKALFMENVKGMSNHDDGNTLKTIIHSMNEIGYTVDFKVYNSLWANVPQNRERLYIIGIRNDLIQKEEWFDTKGKNKIPAMRRELMKEGIRTFNFNWKVVERSIDLSDILEKNVDQSYCLSDKELAELQVFPDETYEGIAIRNATKLGYVIGEVGDSINIAFPTSKTRRGRLGKKIANTLETSVNQGVVEFINNKYIIRKFTPRESLRLQSIPEHHIDTLIENFNDARLYKFAGNGLSINVISLIGSELIKYIK